MTKRGVLNLILAMSILTLVGIYIIMGFYYSGSFPYGTWVNHVYCTGKSVDQINEELKRSALYSGLMIKAKDNNTFFIDGASVGFSVDYTDELNELLASQNPFAWGLNFFTNRDRMIDGKASIDKEKLRETLLQWVIFDEVDGENYEIRRDEEGFFFIDNTRDFPIFDAFYSRVYEAMLSKEYGIDLSQSDECYRKANITQKDLALKDLFEKVDDVQNQEITFTVLDYSFKVTKAQISQWIVTLDELEEVISEEVNEKAPGRGYFIYDGKMDLFPEEYGTTNSFVTDKNGNLILRCSEIYRYFSGQMSGFTTEAFIKRYQNGENVLIPVSGNKDGILFKAEDEYVYLVNALCEGKNLYREVPVPNKSFSIDSSELGSEYILVNMGEQHLSYYKNNSLKLDYDIVTGNTGLGRGTPVGFYHIYNKRYHTILRGVDYASYVNYWLGVNKGIGIHDATWRSKFGGDIYKRSGSHGCINSPLADMEKLYEMVEVGVPVLLFY